MNPHIYDEPEHIKKARTIPLTTPASSRLPHAQPRTEQGATAAKPAHQ